MNNKLSLVFNRTLVALLIFQLTGCGTILYPERRGLKSGHLDAGVVILDAIGLLFFLIPGIIAFAVDFSNGTIYLPATVTVIGRSSRMREIKFDPKHTSYAEIEGIIQKETGKTVKLTQGNIRISRLKSTEDMNQHFAQADIGNNRLALAY